VRYDACRPIQRRAQRCALTEHALESKLRGFRCHELESLRIGAQCFGAFAKPGPEQLHVLWQGEVCRGACTHQRCRKPMIRACSDRGDLDRPTLSARRLPQRRLELLFGSAGAHDSHRARQAIEARGYLDGRVCETTLVSESWPHG
jgi:hypothetical protein